MPFILIVVAIILTLTSGVLAAQDEPAWPRQIDAPEAKIVIYQPQPETFKGDRLTGRAAVSVTPKGKSEPTFGAMWINARVSTDRDTRMVSVLDAKVENVRFPEATTEQEDNFKRLVESEIPKWQLSMSLDRLLASLEMAEKEKIASDNLKMDPPAITFVTYPAVLISIDGAPELRAVEDSSMMRVVNTPFTILQEPGSKTYYLYDGVDWRKAADVKGPWEKDLKPPKKVSELTPKADPPDPKDQPEEPDSEEAETEPPILIVATEPAELIVSKGDPEYSPIEGTDLLYMSNTESDVFKEISSQQNYVVLSGRWFLSGSMNGPWTNVPSDKLPADFAKIPPESAKGDVLTFVAGTQQAKDAIMDAHIPQTTAVKRGGDNTVAVAYDGSPRFQKIEGTEVSYAINTEEAVFSIGREYYCAQEGIWYVSNMVYGPFEVATSVPRELIDAIPPENPHYNVKYIQIYDSTPDVVYVGYTPGYTSTYVYGGTVVYGTGYYYPGWYGPTVYYGYPSTWGFHVRYHPYGGWSYGLSYSTGRFTFGIGYSSRWYPYGYRGGWWGPAGRYGYRGGYRRGYTRGYARGARNANIYNRRRNVARNTPRTRPAGTSRRMAAPASAGRNNVYADRNGNVHRNQNGNWQSRSGGNWSGSKGSGNLQSQHSSRQRGTTRTNSYRSGGRGGGGRGRR